MSPTNSQNAQFERYMLARNGKTEGLSGLGGQRLVNTYVTWNELRRNLLTRKLAQSPAFNFEAIGTTRDAHRAKTARL